MQWNADTSHSNIDFKVRHMAISWVRGNFEDFTFQAETNDNGELVAATATIKTASINTSEKDRDNHLRSADFFDAETYPDITFKSSSIEKTGTNTYTITGDLNMHGVTNPASFNVETSSVIKDPYGNNRTGATITGKLNRKNWGLNWNQTLEFGALLVGEDVTFTIDAQAISSN